ncbi:hypothetical protein O7627_35940 [Solwaraspora sp. WMMD1047]|uniref:hypothetical protein n=1 Tax=Solwaraspora sp. WMMD1047 TaxID=3016102 RepID=UPI002415B454|nr:hypothetical protein [Solwaraspora sp. WMMD1047]MDG4834662.1 hypothetical protein [Solwaraspora sp. WMMD1047]
MAARGWGGSIATAIGVAAGAGAAQLGLGYGLGIIAWLPSADGAAEAAWVASLTWAVWIAATSTIFGATLAHRLGRPDVDRAGAPAEADDRWAPTGPRHGESLRSVDGPLWRISLAVAAAVGALLTVALVAVPARAATRADTFSPQTIAAGYAVLGILLGLLAACWALHSPAVASNIIGTAGWLWSLAVVAVASGVAAGRGLATAQLGVWQITSDGERFWYRDHLYWPAAALALGSALVIGALTARAAARTARTRVGATVSGAVGPLLVAVAYFLTAPRLIGSEPEQLSAHLMAPYAVIAGLAGSALVAALAQRREFASATVEPDRYRSDLDHPEDARAAAADATAPARATGTDPEADRTDEDRQAGPAVGGERTESDRPAAESGREPGPTRRGSAKGLRGRIGRQRATTDDPPPPAGAATSDDRPAD